MLSACGIHLYKTILNGSSNQNGLPFKSAIEWVRRSVCRKINMYGLLQTNAFAMYIHYCSIKCIESNKIYSSDNVIKFSMVMTNLKNKR